jgi:glucokinase-like ROK family protein
MNDLRIGGKALIKDLNRAIVVNEIRKNGPISRTDIAKNTGLGLSTITKITESLIEQDMIYETGEGDSTGGRKPIYLSFNYNFGYVVGIKIEPTDVIMALTNLNGEIIERRVYEFPKGSRSELVLGIISQGLQVIGYDTKERERQILGVGIGVSGLVDKARATLVYSSLLGWGKVAFRPTVRKVINVPVYVDNDVNAYAIAELLYGQGKGLDNFLVVTMGIGIGCGIIINGEIYRGDFGGAGEIGHVIIQKDGKQCYCGQRGCLETCADDDFIINRVKELARSNPRSAFCDKEPTIKDVYKAAREGDECALRAYEEAGRNMGVGLVNAINIFNPSTIILAGEAMVAKDFFMPYIIETAQRNFFYKYKKHIEIKASELGDNGWEIGAAAVAVNELFQAPIYKNRRTLHSF